MNLKQRLISLLADPQFSDSEFRTVRNWLAQGGIMECLQDAEAIRSTLLRYAEQKSQLQRRGAPSTASLNNGTVSEIDHLLRIEAVMTARDALEQLAERVGFQGNLPERISFAEGLRRMIRDIGASEVLSAAHQIRNQRVHGAGGAAWPLNRG
jgi:hypothetical protein